MPGISALFLPLTFSVGQRFKVYNNRDRKMAKKGVPHAGLKIKGLRKITVFTGILSVQGVVTFPQSAII